MFERIHNPQLEVIYRQFRRLEEIVGDLLERPQLDFRSAAKGQASRSFEEISLAGIGGDLRLDLPEMNCEKSVIAFALLSNFFKAGWFLRGESGRYLPAFYFSHGELHQLDGEDSQPQPFPELQRGQVLRLKETPANLSAAQAFGADRRSATFLFYADKDTRFLLSSGLAEPWLVDHVETTQGLLNRWL